MSGFDSKLDKKTKRLVLSGALTVPHLSDAQKKLAKAKGHSTIDISALDALDTSGALLLVDAARETSIAGARDEQRALLELVGGLQLKMPKPPRKVPTGQRIVVGTGRYMYELAAESRRVVTFMGKAAIAVARSIRHPKRLRVGSISHHVEAIGIDALPIIGLIAFLIAIVLAYQGVAQLRPYGGQAFTVDLVAISILREMGVLLTAIMVAGRSGSAFCAEIGVMKAREEVDALEVTGIDAFEVLVVPRIIAIIIALPLLTFFANLLGLTGGYFITNTLIDINFGEYMDRVQRAADGNDLFAGLIKAPVFAFFIGLIGCMHGLRVTGSAESIGRETTTAVVKGIFIVLVLDAFFSILFQKVGI